MGESNCAWTRPLMLRREAMIAASAIYNDLYGNEVGVAGVPASYRMETPPITGYHDYTIMG